MFFKKIIEMFSDKNNNVSFMRFLCFLSFLQSCVLCYLGIFHSPNGITLELTSIISVYISAAFLGKHFSKLVEEGKKPIIKNNKNKNNKNYDF
jgi:hypothetical protein